MHTFYNREVLKYFLVPKTLEDIRERKKILEEELAKLDRHVPMEKRCKSS